MAVETIKNKDGFSVLVDKKIICEMSSGGAHRFRTELQAEIFGKQYERGYTSGSFTSLDVENYITV